MQRQLVETVHVETFQTGDTLVTNLRHYENLRKTQESLQRVMVGIDNQTSNDLLTLDIREALDHLDEIL